MSKRPLTVRERWAPHVMRAACGIGAACALALVTIGVMRICGQVSPLTVGEWLTPLATLLVGAMALLGVVLGLDTWSEDRRRARDDRARSTYEVAVATLMGQFVGKADLEEISRARASVAIWGDERVVEAMAAWSRGLEMARDTSGMDGAGAISLTAEQQVLMRRLTGEVVESVRDAVGAETVSPEKLVAALFNESPVRPRLTHEVGETG